MKENNTPKAIYLKDYKPPAFKIIDVNLSFDLDPMRTKVISVINFMRNKDADFESDLILDGEDIELHKLSLEGNELEPSAYEQDDQQLIVKNVPDSFQLEVVNTICPQNNTSLEGLYISSGNFCTQCEAQGFRKITYYLDRPDVLAKFIVTIRADKAQFPVMLSNGNLAEKSDHDSDIHQVIWHDPFPKPSYLFALVAGNLVSLDDVYTTASGRKVDLQIFVESHNRNKCRHAMDSLIRAMRWDEERFGLEYDLDCYMIVAVDDFNMGAMENKGLNIFNSKYVLANAESATDTDYQYIQGVIGHEYFHNWTGNRVTCRDWFQLSLKEGLTVFRDQEFSSEMGMRAVKRIEDVRRLRTVQFAEDAGPMSHPVRPNSYIEINNFYTVTVYEKGAEVIRMQNTLLGEEGFRKGLDLYFQRHDGQAVTTDDFVAAMEDANNVDLQQFRLWYTQAGTPKLKISSEFDEKNQTYALTISQSCKPTANQEHKEIMNIPVVVGLLDSDGNDLQLELDSGECSDSGSIVLNVKEQQQKFTFKNIETKPIPSLLRNFSAPVTIEYDYSNQDLSYLIANDSNSFNRWDASQSLAMRYIKQLIADYNDNRKLAIADYYVDAFESLLRNREQPAALIAAALMLPSERYIAEQMDIVDVEAIHETREFIMTQLAKQLRSVLHETYFEFKDSGEYKIDSETIGRRSLKNTCLCYLTQLGDADVIGIAINQYRDSNNMTDKLLALTLIADIEGEMRADILDDFYNLWHEDKLVVNKWLTVQALSKHAKTLEHVKELMSHRSFSIKNPNNVYALIGSFCLGNQVHFNNVNGEGYKLLGDCVLQLDKLNPMVAARMVSGFNQWKRFDDTRQNLMKNELDRLVSARGLSRDVYEIVSKNLKQ